MSSASDARAGGAFVEIYAKDKTKAALQGMEARMRKFAVTVGMIGVGMAAAGTVITAPMLRGLNIASELGTELETANRRTGIGFEDLQSLAYALRTDIAGVASAAGTMSSVIQDAINDPAGAAAQRIAALGMSVEDLNRATQADRIRMFGDAVSRLNAGSRGVATAALLGNAALDTSGGRVGITEREQRARGLGGIVSNDDVRLLEQYNAAQRDLGVATKGFWAALGTAAAPAMTDFFSLLTKVIGQVKEWTDANRPLLDIIFRIADKVVLLGLGIGVLAAGIYAASYAFTFLNFVMGLASTGFGVATIAGWAYTAGIAVWTAAVWAYNVAMKVAHILTWAWVPLLAAVGLAIQSIPFLIIAAVAVGIAYLLGIPDMLSAVGNQIVAGFSRIFGHVTSLFWDLVGTASQAWGGIMDAFAIGDWEMMWEIAKTAASLAWLQIKRFGAATWIELKYVFLGVIDSIVDGIEDAFADVWTALKVGWYELMAIIIEAMGPIVRSIGAILETMEQIDPTGFAGAAADALSNAIGADARAEMAGALRERQMQVVRDARTEENARDLQRADRDRDLAAARLIELRESADARAPEIAEAQLALDRLTASAAILRGMEDVNREMRAAPPAGRENFDQTMARTVVMGTFAADAVRGFAGSRNPNARLEELNEDVVDGINRVVDAIRDIPAVVMG